MRISQKKSNKKLKVIIITSIAVLVIAGSIFAYLHYSKKSDNIQNGVNYNPPTQDEKSTGDTIKQQDSTGSDPTPQPTQPTTPTDIHSTIGITITSANQASDILSIHTLIQTVTSSGTCTLSMTGPSGKTYTSTAGVQAGPSSSTCEGFNVPVSSLSTGDWSVTVSFQNDTLKGSATKDIPIQ